MEVLDSPVTEHQPVIMRKLSFVTESFPGGFFGNSVAIVWMDKSKAFVRIREPLLRIQSTNSEHFLRPVKRFATGQAVGPTARMGHPLRFG